MDLAPVAGLVGLLFVKEMGVPIPVPGDLLVLGAGIAASGSGLAAPAELVAILVAGFLGGSLQFLLVRGAFRRPLLRILARFGVSAERLDRLADWLRRRGARGVAIARATPGLRVGAISASGIAALPFPAFLGGLVAGNTVFVGGHFLFGYVVGAPALDLIARAGGLAVGVIAFVALAVLGFVAWRILRRRQRVASSSPRSDMATAASWTEAACPACLAVTLGARARSRGVAAPQSAAPL
jgi:membrane protein DedA with SNARE-associated domain